MRSVCVPAVASSSAISFICSRVQNIEPAVDFSKANASVVVQVIRFRRCNAEKLTDTAPVQVNSQIPYFLESHLHPTWKIFYVFPRRVVRNVLVRLHCEMIAHQYWASSSSPTHKDQ